MLFFFFFFWYVDLSFVDLLRPTYDVYSYTCLLYPYTLLKHLNWHKQYYNIVLCCTVYIYVELNQTRSRTTKLMSLSKAFRYTRTHTHPYTPIEWTQSLVYTELVYFADGGIQKKKRSPTNRPTNHTLHSCICIECSRTNIVPLSDVYIYTYLNEQIDYAGYYLIVRHDNHIWTHS